LTVTATLVEMIHPRADQSTAWQAHKGGPMRSRALAIGGSIAALSFAAAPMVAASPDAHSRDAKADRHHIENGRDASTSRYFDSRDHSSASSSSTDPSSPDQSSTNQSSTNQSAPDPSSPDPSSETLLDR
jgi:hypothetical protein